MVPAILVTLIGILIILGGFLIFEDSLIIWGAIFLVVGIVLFPWKTDPVKAKTVKTIERVDTLRTNDSITSYTIFYTE